MQPSFFDSYAPAPEADLQKFEAMLGLALTPDYRCFLSEINGGSPQPMFFRSQSGRVYEIAFWYGLDYAAAEGPINLHLRWMVGDLLFRSPLSLICIGRSYDGNLLFLSLDLADRGSVYLWLHDAHPQQIWDKGPLDENPQQREERMGIEKLAGSVAELLDAAITEEQRQAHFQAQLGI